MAPDLKQRNLGLISPESAVNILRSSGNIEKITKNFPEIKQLTDISQSRQAIGSKIRMLNTDETQSFTSGAPPKEEEFSNNGIAQAIHGYLKSISMDLKKDFKWDRKSISDFIDKKYGVKLSQMMATEAFISCEQNDELQPNE